MVQLVDSDIKTREVLGWKGVHVLHFIGSSCSQKLRIFLNLKGIAWESHLVDLPGNENFRPWFLGINPRGLVPVLVHDGAVHIESNDIIQYLEKTFPAPRLIPAGHENEVAALLKHEDDLHLDLRTLSFRFVFAPPGPPKPAEALAELRRERRRHGAGREGSRQGNPDRVLAARRERRLHRRAGARLGAEIPRRVRRARPAARAAALSDGRTPERARHRLVHLRVPAVARRLSVQAAASAGRRLGRQACAPGRSSPRRSLAAGARAEAATRRRAARRWRQVAGF